MQNLMALLMIAGGIMWAIGSIWILIVAFRTNAALGLACMFIPFFELVFVYQNWRDNWKPFMVLLSGKILLFAVIVNLPKPY